MKQTYIRLTDANKKQLDSIGKDTGLTKNAIINYILTEYLNSSRNVLNINFKSVILQDVRHSIECRKQK